MAVKDEQTKGVEQTEFPVDNRPLIGSFILLFLVFIGLCVTVYFQNSSESWGIGNILLVFAFCFAAYVQRNDPFRVTGILIGGAVICVLVFLLTGGEESDEGVRKEGSKTVPYSNLPSPEGFGQ
jgi:hypothetical protein